jgi:hypothetical protein
MTNTKTTEDQLSAELVREFLDYNPETGVFMWKWRDRKHFTSDRTWKIWNTRFANTVAGNVRKDGYYRIVFFRKLYYAHRLAWLLYYGEWPKVIDHKNRNPSDNRITNLRNGTQQQNNMNHPIRGKVAFYGVYWNDAKQKYEAQISINNKTKHLGLFECPIEAAITRDGAAFLYRGDRANLNFPEIEYDEYDK